MTEPLRKRSNIVVVGGFVGSGRGCGTTIKGNSQGNLVVGAGVHVGGIFAKERQCHSMLKQRAK